MRVRYVVQTTIGAVVALTMAGTALAAWITGARFTDAVALIVLAWYVAWVGIPR